MAKLKQLVIHCTATPEGREVTAADIRAWHTNPTSKGGRGWKQVGYTDLFHLDGTVERNVNSQVKVLEGYLRKKYNEPLGIKVATFDAGLLNVGLEIEGETMMVWFGLSSEEQLKGVPLKDELRDKFTETDFVVYIPAGLDKLRVEADIEKYKLALVTYKIIQQ